MPESVNPVAPPARQKPAASKSPKAPKAPPPQPPPAPEPEEDHVGLKEALASTAPVSEDLLRNLASPFRPRDLNALIIEHCDRHNIQGDARAKLDPHKFLKEHGLPNPTKKYRVVGYKGDKELPPDEFEAVDESEASALYREKHIPKDPHQWRCRVFLLEY